MCVIRMKTECESVPHWRGEVLVDYLSPVLYITKTAPDMESLSLPV